MTDEIERVARALAIADGKDPDAPAWARMAAGQYLPEGICWRDQYADKARAAIASIRKDDELRDALEPFAIEPDADGAFDISHIGPDDFNRARSALSKEQEKSPGQSSGG